MRRLKIVMPFLWVVVTLALGVWPFAPAAHGQAPNPRKRKFLLPRLIHVAALLGFSLFLFAPAGSGQGSRKDDVVFNSRGTPLAGAAVRVCVMPASGQPCSPLALIYSDVALTQALPNPTTTDGLGNYNFYAAPGKYMIEISGPGITTRQIPNVILPSDPTAPAFSSVSSTGGISAFSLNLTGNLTVNGNASVLGSLASGTLNLTNQLTPPGAAGTGTVNVYTKNDKRLYYKDDTGAEIGPVANTTGAQTNVTNTFTAQQNFDANTAFKGPNPWFDITRFGGVASIQTTTGGISSASPTLTLAAAQDFANGQGIVVLGAGSATALSTPSGVTVSPQYITGGSTTYSYQVACEDFAGGVTAASASGSTTAGAALLGVQNTVNISSAVRTNGVVTVTTAAQHTFSPGMPVNIAGAPNGDFNATVIVTSTPSSTTFTFNQATAANASVSSGTVQGIAYNKVIWTSANVNTNTILRCWIYRNNALAGVTPGQDTYFEDYGFGLNTAGSVPSYVPTTPPASAIPGYLATTISSGGGTTTLTLAANAGTTVSGAAVLHDNVPALNAAAAASAGTQRGGVVFVPNSASSTPYQLNSAWQIPAAKYILAGGFNVSQPMIPGSGVTLEGWPGSAVISTPPFGRSYYAQITCGTSPSGGSGGGVCPFPFFYAPPTRTNIVLRNIQVTASTSQAVGLLADAAPDGSGSTYLIFDNSYFNMGAQGTGLVIKGGFGFYFNNTGFNSANSAFGSPQLVRFTTMNSSSISANMAGIVHFADCVFNGTGVQFDTLPRPVTSTGGQQFSFRNTLFEGGTSNFLRVNIGGNAFSANYYLQNVDYADPRGGTATPMIDVTNSTNVQGMDLATLTTSNASQPLVVGNPFGLTIRGVLPASAGVGSANYVALTPNNFMDMHNVQVLATGAGMSVPGSLPTSTPTAAVSSGGSVPLGVWNYAVSKVDYSGRETTIGPTSANALVTSGNQTVTVDCTDPIGGNIQFLRIYRSNGGGFARVVGADSLTTCHIVDSSASSTGIVSALYSAAGDPVVDTSGVAAAKFRVNGELVQSAPRAEQNVFLPGALTSTWTGSTWTIDRAITVTRIEAQAKTAPAGCSTNAVVRLSDGTSPVNVTISGAANSSGALGQNYSAGAALSISVATASAGCTTNPADVNVTVQYRMQ